MNRSVPLAVAAAAMQDVSGGDYTMLATSVDEPFDTVTIAAFVPVNHARSWPGHGDVAWQPAAP